MAKHPLTERVYALSKLVEWRRKRRGVYRYWATGNRAQTLMFIIKTNTFGQHKGLSITTLTDDQNALMEKKLAELEADPTKFDSFVQVYETVIFKEYDYARESARIRKGA